MTFICNHDELTQDNIVWFYIISFSCKLPLEREENLYNQTITIKVMAQQYTISALGNMRLQVFF